MADPAFVLSGRPWRSAAYLLTGGLAGAVTCAVLVLGTAVGGSLALVLVGLPLLAALALAGLPFGALERRRMRWIDPRPAPSPHRTPDRTGLTAWARLRFRERATWWELGYTVLTAFVLCWCDLLVLGFALAVPGALMATPALLATEGEVHVLKTLHIDSYGNAWALALLGAVLLVAFSYPLTAFAGVRAELARFLLVPGDDSSQRRITELTDSRVRLVDAFEAERRRIERDLHDGAQQRLVALSMTLGLARLDAPPGSRLAGQLAVAHREAGQVLTELRELINGIHPQILTDRGLPDAVADAADRSPVPVDVSFDLPGRLPDAVETAAYFAVCEALANVAKHSGATRATVTGGHDGTHLDVRIHDNGRGGAGRPAGPPADPAKQGGTGLTGLADRVSVVAGTLDVTSPPGGPTLLHIRIPAPAAPRPTRRA
ncbi:sensor histidine kinase [Streptomyces sp. So13.3]|uniref:sensor histidine kinase n=1 Tax=Streptomyces TaxID=1883 RepID=UPI001106A783|nr:MULTISPECIES: sensor domain-containing protein [Streptomyces]MCZ4099503.1 sensor domain-containing protein [Streptomyces sp. H39-C1]QNA78062.1 sensor histidine kinase [Streptomyces sp. So13.3]